MNVRIKWVSTVLGIRLKPRRHRTWILIKAGSLELSSNQQLFIEWLLCAGIFLGARETVVNRHTKFLYLFWGRVEGECIINKSIPETGKYCEEN